MIAPGRVSAGALINDWPGQPSALASSGSRQAHPRPGQSFMRTSARYRIALHAIHKESLRYRVPFHGIEPRPLLDDSTVQKMSGAPARRGRATHQLNPVGERR